ncbi:MAG TPA: hypothetical protein VN938_16180 [Xanthobacteraceae bacterium]|nr:hypothetical protein [Xanthobacteraceae bacterium]
MEERATDFVEAMAVIAVIGVLAFLIGWLVRMPQGQHAPAGGAAAVGQSPRWYEFALALLLLAAIAAFLIWLISSGQQWVWGETFFDWRSDPRAIAFAAIMIGIGVVGLAVSLAYTVVQSSQPIAAPRAKDAALAESAAVPAAVPAASPLRLLGLIALVVAIVLLCWIALPRADQFGLLTQLIYPASVGLALVLVFDKATRTWGAKRGAETFREWLFCDLFAFLLVLAFLNLRSLGKPDTYAASFWDILNLVLWFAAFWSVDRGVARGRFLAGYGYLVIAPLLLLIWQAVTGTPAPASWWGTVWPFLILGAVFFVLEAITLVASSGERQTLAAVKDTLFLFLYAVLLIVAARSHG